MYAGCIPISSQSTCAWNASGSRPVVTTDVRYNRSPCHGLWPRTPRASTIRVLQPVRQHGSLTQSDGPSIFYREDTPEWSSQRGVHDPHRTLLAGRGRIDRFHLISRVRASRPQSTVVPGLRDSRPDERRDIKDDTSRRRERRQRRDLSLSR